MKNQLPAARLLIVLGSIAVGLWLLWAFLGSAIAVAIFGAADTERSGQWGDTFGSLNALFSALGFVAIFVTLLLQRDALKSQLSELERQREDIEKQERRVQEAQLEAHRDRFEGSFFRLLDLMRELRQELRFTHTDKFNASPSTQRSRELFEGALALKAIEREIAFWLAEARPTTKEELARIYEESIHTRAENSLSPYFRIVYTLLRRVSEDRVFSNTEKAAYGNLIRAQMTSPDLAVAGINGLHAVSANFKRYLEEYRMFKYLPEGVIKDNLKLYYAADAFLGRD